MQVKLFDEFWFVFLKSKYLIHNFHEFLQFYSFFQYIAVNTNIPLVGLLTFEDDSVSHWDKLKHL